MSHYNTITCPGVFMAVDGLGVLLTGESGIGKSEIALALISRSHGLVADDAVTFATTDNGLIGRCDPLLQNFLEVRGIGVLDIHAMFGVSAIVQSQSLDLIINLISTNSDVFKQIDRIHGLRKTNKILGIDIPHITIPVAPGRNLSIIVEAAVRDHILRKKGYCASDTFSKKHFKAMHKDKYTELRHLR